MSERKREVRIYMVDYICDEEGCGGFMKHHFEKGALRSIWPVMQTFLHKCGMCGAEKTLDNIYPYEVREAVE